MELIIIKSFKITPVSIFKIFCKVNLLKKFVVFVTFELILIHNRWKVEKKSVNDTPNQRKITTKNYWFSSQNTIFTKKKSKMILIKTSRAYCSLMRSIEGTITNCKEDVLT